MSDEHNRDIAVLQSEILHLKSTINGLDKDLEELRNEKKKDLRWGIATLGAIILALIGYIWNAPHISH